ncbi:MAG: FecR domain-containing protein [Pseudomonadota bacterium]
MQKAIPASLRVLNLRVLALVFVSLLLSVTAQAAEPVGELKFARGDVVIKSNSGDVRKGISGDTVMRNELIETGTASLAILLLNDDSRMTIRPNSAFRVERLIVEGEPSNQGAILNLLRGGLRLATGLIGKRNPSGYQLNALVATVGIRGTEFNARICGVDCAAEEKRLADGDSEGEINEGLYVNVDEGKVALRNYAEGEPLELAKGESGFVSDAYSLPIKLSFIPVFQALDLIPSPSSLDFDNIELPDDLFGSSDSSEESAVVAAAAGSGAEEAFSGFDISGDWETDDVDYGQDPPVSERIWFFGASPDLEFTFEQEGNKFTGEMDGDREGTFKGKIDGDEITFEFTLEARGGEIKPGEGKWVVKDDDTLEGDFLIFDSRFGNVRGKWVIERD